MAQQALYDAQQQWNQSVYEDEFDYDYRTKKKTVTRKGAISLYNEAFEYWQPIMTANPRLDDGQLARNLIDHIKEYQKMLDFTNREWPKDFPMQKFIDARAQRGERDGLPTTAQLTEFADESDEMEDDDQDSADESGETPPDETTSTQEPPATSAEPSP